MTGGGRPLISMREALSDPQLLGNALSGDCWRAWRILLIAAMGEALDEDERAIFDRLTDRQREPLVRVEERPRWPSIWPVSLTIETFWRSASGRLS